MCYRTTLGGDDLQQDDVQRGDTRPHGKMHCDDVSDDVGETDKEIHVAWIDFICFCQI